MERESSYVTLNLYPKALESEKNQNQRLLIHRWLWIEGIENLDWVEGRNVVVEVNSEREDRSVTVTSGCVTDEWWLFTEKWNRIGEIGFGLFSLFLY
jgi:hypothetical protein